MIDDRRRQGAGGVFRLMYRSRDLVPEQDRADEMGDLFARARSGNEKRRITGALLVSGDWFVQVLEGDEEHVRSLFERIERDPRHADIEVLAEGPVDGRTFEHWSMGEVTPSESYLPLIARLSEIQSGGGRGDRPEKDRLLAAMRTALEDPGTGAGSGTE